MHKKSSHCPHRLWITLWAVFTAFALMLLASEASAQKFIDAPGLGSNSAWTVYAFGNAQAVSDVFRAIANFTKSDVFGGLVALLAVIGVLSVGISSGFSTLIARKFISYTVFVFLVVYLLFGYPTKNPISVRIEVIDTVDGTWKAPVTVPAVIGIPAALISQAGHYITVQAEASFPLPDQLKLSKGAPFNLAATLLSDMSKAKIQDPNLANSLAYYVQDCFVLGVAQGQLDPAVLLNSTNFLTDIRTSFVSVYINTTLPDGTPQLASCVDVHGRIVTAVNALGNEASSFMSDASSWHGTPALSVVNAAADQVGLWASNGSLNQAGGSLVKQAAVLSAFRPAFGQAAAATGNSDFLTSIAVTQATESQKSSWIIGAEIFNRMMGYFFAVLQVFIYALTPLILAAALIPSLGMSLLKNFVQVLIWLALWQPMLAIVNFVVLSMQQSSLGGALASTGSSLGFTMNNIGLISERTSNLTAAATMMGTMVPVLAWAFVKGSVDFSRMIGSAVGENFAQSAGNTLTTGNYSLNSASMDAFTANKNSISQISDFGMGNTVGDQLMSKKWDSGGLQMGIQGTPVTAVGTSTVDTSVGGSHARNASKQTSAAEDHLRGSAWAASNGYSLGNDGNWTRQGVTNTSADVSGRASLGRGGSSGRSVDTNGNPDLRDSSSASLPAETVPQTTSPPTGRMAKNLAAVAKVLKHFSAQAGVSGTLQHLDTTGFGVKAGETESANIADNFNHSHRSSVQHSDADSANTQKAYSDRTAMTISAALSFSEQMAAYRQAWRPSNFSGSMAMLSQSAHRYGSSSGDSDIASRVEQLRSQGAILDAQDRIKDATLAQQRIWGNQLLVNFKTASNGSDIVRRTDDIANKTQGDLGLYRQGGTRGLLSQAADITPFLKSEASDLSGTGPRQRKSSS